MEVPEASSTHRHSFNGVIAALVLLGAATGWSATSRLSLDRSDTPSQESYKGLTEIAITPPFGGARLTIEIDGQVVAKSLGAPYTTQVDFGPATVEHRIRITAKDPDGGSPMVWTRTINPGQRPLMVNLQFDQGASAFAADASASVDDPIVKVEFYGSNGLIHSFTEPPYRVVVSPEVANELVRVTVTTQSGAEATGMFAGGAEVLAQSYDVRTVRLYVSVTDRSGQTRSDVAPDKFEVLDNGTKTRIIDVGRASTDPISVALVLDASASMTPFMEMATKAANSFLQKVLRPDDRCAVFAIQSVPRRTLALTVGPAAAGKALGSIRAAGDTALYDSVASAIRELKGEKARRAIVVLSDGEDTASVNSFDDLVKDATGAGIPVYFIAFSGDNRTIIGFDKMRYLVSQTGGFLASASDKSLPEKYRLIEKDLREQYAIRYQVSDLSKPNEWRRVRVVLKSPQLTARTITGYYTP